MELEEKKISEEEIGWVKMLSNGVSTDEVAKYAKLPPGTFAYKLSLLRAKVGCENMASLIAYFFKHDLIN